MNTFHFSDIEFKEFKSELRKMIRESVEEVLQSRSIISQTQTGNSEVASEELSSNGFPQENKEQFLTRQEVSELLRVSFVTLNNWKNSGKLKPYRVGGKRVLYKSEDVYAFFKDV